jgi:hypothetical protein
LVRSYSCACVCARRPAWLCTSLCVCVATAAGRFAAKRREQGWLCARLSDTVHNRVVAVGHRWCAGAGAVGGGARAV